jgi:hypothetical protein
MARSFACCRAQVRAPEMGAAFRLTPPDLGRGKVFTTRAFVFMPWILNCRPETASSIKRLFNRCGIPGSYPTIKVAYGGGNFGIDSTSLHHRDLVVED